MTRTDGRRHEEQLRKNRDVWHDYNGMVRTRIIRKGRRRSVGKWNPEYSIWKSFGVEG
jgi:hypothetical protein